MIPARDRIALPGPRTLWWALGLAAVAVPLGLLVASSWRVAPGAESRVIRHQVRELNMMWRVNAETEKLVEKRLRELAQPASNTAGVPGAVTQSDGRGDPKAPDAGRPGAGADRKVTSNRDSATLGLAQLAEKRAIEERLLRELFSRAKQALLRGDAEPGLPPDAAVQAVVAHCVATDRRALAVELVASLHKPSRDVRIAIAAAAPIGAARRLSQLTPAAAADAASSLAFGRTWSRFERDSVRARLHALAGHGGRSTRLYRRLNTERDTIFAAFNALRMGVALAGLIGLFMLLAAVVRSWAAGVAGEPRLGWLRGRFPGLGDERPLHRDPIVLVLGAGAWLLGYLLAGTLFSLLPGPRSVAGMAVLFQSAAGIAVTWAVFTAFARTDPPLAAARIFWRPNDMPSAWSASTAALAAFCALWPFVAVAFLVSAVLFGSDAQPHAVAQMMLDEPDPMMLAAMGLAVVVVAPIGEELFFRGFLHQLLRQHFGVFTAIVVTAALFSAVHMSPMFALVFFTLGAAFSLVFEWVGSLWAPIVLHGLWNACVFVYVVCVAYS